MNDRDTFAAAALMGLLAGREGGNRVQQAYGMADAMLRERGKADRDNCVAANQPEIPCPRSSAVPYAWATAYAVTRACEIANHDAAPAARAESRLKEPNGHATGEPGGDLKARLGTGDTPVTKPLPKEKRAEVSAAEPVAWAVLAKDIGATAATCSTFMEAERLAARSADWRKEIVPLYTTPQPTLTDAEREAIEVAKNLADSASRQYRLEESPVYADHFERIAAILRDLLGRMK